jgi:hypothetical protein
MGKLPYMVMIRCPAEDAAIPTDITCDIADFINLGIDFLLIVPHVGSDINGQSRTLGCAMLHTRGEN